MSIKDYDSQYAGYGIPSIGPVDSGSTQVTATTPETLTLTVPTLADGTQPTVIRGKLVVSINTPNASLVLGQIDISSSDGTHTVCHASVAAAVAATAGRGGVFVFDLFIDRVDTTTIATIAIVVASSGTSTFKIWARFLGEHD